MKRFLNKTLIIIGISLASTFTMLVTNNDSCYATSALLGYTKAKMDYDPIPEKTEELEALPDKQRMEIVMLDEYIFAVTYTDDIGKPEVKFDLLFSKPKKPHLFTKPIEQCKRKRNNYRTTDDFIS